MLLLTPHLGNWEFGGLWLTRRGVELQVLTLSEPGRRFTAMRQAARHRWNIQTLVVGEDPFAFVEVIRRLEQGATVALLIDRPASSAAAQVELFGRPFAASTAPAELARASGCALLPVYLPRGKRTYGAHILPAIDYDRPSLRARPARLELSQQILRAFEPVIRRHLDQWFRLVPVWPLSTLRRKFVSMAPVSLTPNFSWVNSGTEPTETVSTVSCSAPLPPFVALLVAVRRKPLK